MDKLFAAVERLYEPYITVWEDICNIESPTENKAAVDEVSAYITAIARRHGWQVEVCAQEQAGDVVCITMNPTATGAPITLSGHMDTVHPIGSFGTPAVHRDEEKIYGPGVTDCKGGLAVALLAMHALEEAAHKIVALEVHKDNTGIPCVDNMGAAGDRIHSPDEYAYLTSLKENAKRIAAVVWHY